MYILNVIIKSYMLLIKQEQIKLLFLVVFYLISALIQVLGVASIAPFMALLATPDIIYTNKIYLLVYNYFNFNDATEFIVAIGVCSLSMMIVSNVMGMLTLFLSIRFSIVIGNSIQCRLYENLMFRPYLYHKTVNHSTSIATIKGQAPRFVYMVLQPLLLLISNFLVCLVILAGLIYLDSLNALLVGAILGGAYFCTYLFIKGLLKKHGEFITVQNIETQKVLTEGFIGIKDVTLNKLHKNFIERFKYFNLKGLNSTSIISLVGDIPKFVIETIAFSVIFITAIITLVSGKNTETIITLLSIYVIAGYRLLPTLQQVFKSVSSLSANGSVTSELSEYLSTSVNVQYNFTKQPIEDVQEIRLENINFKYPSSTDITLKNITVSFTNKMINTIAGHSGSGKTTLIDLLIGLIPPDSGKIFINNKEADFNAIMRLQQSCGYVPQHIFILDDTVVANVAFGVDKKDIDQKRIKEALQKADAWEFVQKLPDGIHSKLGEDGKLLSGGQRQKIGIARSLYKNTKLLILDEPTSALDIESEYEFMLLLQALKNDLLIIIISHRPSAIKCSDLITLVANGEIESHGSLAYLQETNLHFRSMLEKSSFEIKNNNGCN